MTWKEVDTYTLSWWHDGSRGEIVLTFKDGDSISCRSLHCEDFTAMVYILRHERIVWYEDVHGILMASHKQPDEITSKENKTP